MIVPMTETNSEPRQPKRFEKKASYFALEARRRSRRLALSLCDFRSPPIRLLGFLVSP
jgi:hypothetical protein